MGTDPRGRRGWEESLDSCQPSSNVRRMVSDSLIAVPIAKFWHCVSIRYASAGFPAESETSVADVVFLANPEIPAQTLSGVSMQKRPLPMCSPPSWMVRLGSAG